MKELFFKQRELCVSGLFLILAIIVTAFILNWTEHSRDLSNAGVFFVKLLPFALALVGIARFPAVKRSRIIPQLLLLLLFAVLWCYFTPRLFYAFMDHPDDFDSYYLIIQLMLPFTILALALAFRLGGAATRDVAVFGINGLLILVSGLEDLFALLLRSVVDAGFVFPEIWTWADHMSVFIGRPLAKNEAFVFIGIHICLVGLVLFLAYSGTSPLNRPKKTGAVK